MSQSHSIKILFFAQIRERLNCQQMEFKLTAPLSINELIQKLKRTNQIWDDVFNNDILCAVNQEVSSPQKILHPGDEIAFFPPVTGG